MLQVGTVVATGVFSVSFFSELMLKVFVCFFQVAKTDAEYDPGSPGRTLGTHRVFTKSTIFSIFGTFNHPNLGTIISIIFIFSLTSMG